ncbi:hypothetical protein HHK36_001379 [Tetracentron sinense]|uniref:Zinc finger PHD-type domain-containing protein n=1 Tax=Tetracentron sinense TaxID=13715 RepID=A0A835DR41_TETSI|nr:hypothetical protein HHK36_001379 [Tetracentron sinense]
MKGLSSDPPDDWGDDTWTVECICGVNFDDGEEMVDCDECGVWVHTRCSRFVKGETSFTCQKCKGEKNRDNSEETEVAQLLVELPTKTIRMDNLYPRHSFRLWADVPIEEKVHVQGVPGGDPALFQGLSSVFNPELWKCGGYVPKKFNFQYREFPCWDGKREVDARAVEENENPVDRGAGVLFSLSKEIVSAIPLETFIGLRAGCESKPTPKEMKWEGKDLNVGHVQNGMKRERNQLRPFGVHSGKGKKEGLEGPKSKDPSGNEKARGADKEANNIKRVASTPANDAQKSEFHEDGGFKVAKTRFQDTRNEERNDAVLPEPVSDGCLEATSNVDKPKIAKAHSSGGFSHDTSRHIFPILTVFKEDKVDNRVPTRTETDIVVSLLESNDVRSFALKHEDVNMAFDGLDHLNEERGDPGEFDGGSSSAAMDFQKSKPPVGELLGAALGVPDNQMRQDSSVSLISIQPYVEVKSEANDDHPRSYSDLPCSPRSDVKLDDTKYLAKHSGRSTAAHLSENLQVHVTVVSSVPSSDPKAQDVDGESEAVSELHSDKIAELSGESCWHEQELEDSGEALTMLEENGSKLAEEPSKFEVIDPSPTAPLNQHKVVVGVGKSSSTTVMIPKSVSGICKSSGTSASTNTQRPIYSTKQRVKVNTHANLKKGPAVSDMVKDDFRHEMSRKTTKEHRKASTLPALNASLANRISHASVSKRTLSDTKEQALNTSSRASLTQNIAVSSACGEFGSSLQTQSASHVQNKTTMSGFSLKAEKFNPLSSQPRCKVNHSPSMHPPAPLNTSATLSDEEVSAELLLPFITILLGKATSHVVSLFWQLALLLHQELNSSPRVPRVPRLCHTGSIPQLASPTVTSMLVKRLPSSAGKDRILVSRRRNIADASSDYSCSSHELTDETKKMDRIPSSPDRRRQDPVCTTDSCSKREAGSGSPAIVHSVKKNLPLVSTISNGGPSSSTEVNNQNFPSILHSPKSILDDDTGTIVGPAPRTLPGLIDEIMSKGSPMTYEELCNAVLPHWHNLRKHNGDRYAYTSHSQAVLDCLRNRNEWAQLVDRGPKTNASRKRRKVDAEPPIANLEENEHGKCRTLKEVERKSVEPHREDFPKGKRKVRKRRRLALQGRGIKDVRKRQNAEALTDEDLSLFSHSSEEGTECIFSEDESHGARMRLVRSEASTSSDEMETGS